MPSSLFTVAAYAAAANPLLGTWVADAAALDAHAPAAPTMTITREAISFGSGKREVGVAPISTVERAGTTLLVRTRLGDTYRFRFTGVDRMCRLADVSPRGLAAQSQCFSRRHAKA